MFNCQLEMQFQVTGIQHNTGARVVLDVEAPNRALAERQVASQGVEVTHIAAMEEDPEAAARRARNRGQDTDDGSRSRLLIGIIIVLALAAVTYFWIWPRLHSLTNQ